MSEDGNEAYFKDSLVSSADRFFYNSIQDRMFKNHADRLEKTFKENNRNIVFEVMIMSMYGGLLYFGTETGLIIVTKADCGYKAHSDEDIYPDLDLILKDRYPWVTHDPNTIPFLLSFIKRSNFNPDRNILKRISYLFQLGYMEIVKLQASSHDYVRDTFPSLENKDNEIRECFFYSKTLKMPLIEHENVKFSNIKLFAIYFLSFLFVSFILFLIEFIIFWFKRYKIQKRKQTWYLIKIINR